MMTEKNPPSRLDLILSLAMEKEDADHSPLNKNDYYKTILGQISRGKIFSWNWSAFFCTYWWFLYRRMYFLSLFIVFLLAPAMLLEEIFHLELNKHLVFLGAIFFQMILCGALGNWLYYQSLSHRVRQGYPLISPPATDVAWVFFWVLLGALYLPLILIIVLALTIINRRKIAAALAKSRAATPPQQ